MKVKLIQNKISLDIVVTYAKKKKVIIKLLILLNIYKLK